MKNKNIQINIQTIFFYNCNVSGCVTMVLTPLRSLKKTVQIALKYFAYTICFTVNVKSGSKQKWTN